MNPTLQALNNLKAAADQMSAPLAVHEQLSKDYALLARILTPEQTDKPMYTLPVKKKGNGQYE